ncbi:protein of unknown function [Candidatus Nitrosocaldus cavascurensis]|uniref:Uncharacterized protein n=1 Tax=Candidatus Nitrosocaldus cavascurensis TaxID=2058097 RepID=A0A2K5APE7_9ARCH|nr:protein of unknown function [Candidatus Nitrosocaldus cavascurensis]
MRAGEPQGSQGFESPSRRHYILVCVHNYKSIRVLAGVLAVNADGYDYEEE